jgi:peptidoglycan/xylan/chitin deacetylase (PgdA/CDA1 family)
MSKNIPLLLTIDLEEFDIPLEFGQTIDLQEQLAVSLEGLNNLLVVLKKHKAVATFFTTAQWALHHPDVMRQLVLEGHEIASHAFFHSQFNPKDYALSKKTLESITNQPVKGFRMPRLRPVDFDILKQEGYTYDASMNPTYLPGRYNNLSQPIKPHHNGRVFVLPSSVTPILRIPFFGLSFKNLPLSINRFLFRKIVKNGVFVFYIHPWEFADIQDYQLPSYVKRVCGQDLVRKLDSFLDYASNSGYFSTCQNYFQG